MKKNKTRIILFSILCIGLIVSFKAIDIGSIGEKDATGKKSDITESSERNLATLIPYYKTLENAGIIIDKLDSPILHGMIQGNGDLHSFFYAKNKKIILRLAKNDVYDARIDTEDDPELARIDIATGKTSRKLTIPPSWEKPYPLSINFVNLEIDYSGKQNAEIDILRSCSNINDGEILIRPLLQDNVFYIKTSNSIKIKGKKWKPIPSAEIGETDGVKWVKQNLPPDETGDWKGMQVVSALASNGSDHFLAVVTSLENANPMASALNLAQSYLKKKTEEIIQTHEDIWSEFWQASGIKLSDDNLTKHWYRNLYLSRCAQNPKSQAIGLFIGPPLKPLEGWHDNYTINYNFQQTFWSFLNTNHVEYVDPYNKVILDYLPRAKWFANQTYGIDGAFYPHNIYRHEPVHPEECKSNNNRMFAGGPWAYTLGLSSFLMHNLWLSYKYQPSVEKLEKIYPAISEMARFYVNFCEKCKIDENGKLVLGPSVSPEHMPFGIYNCPFDIAFMQFSFRGFIEASEKLNINRDLAIDAKRFLMMMPDYPVQKSSDLVVDRKGGVPIEYNIPVPITPVFPAEQITWFSSDEEKKLFENTLNKIETNGNNSTIMLAVAKARLSTPDALSWLKKEIDIRSKPNGSMNLSHEIAAFNSFGHFTEMFAVSGAISELLLQSVDEIIRVFPAWPKEKDGEFQNLRTQGGFLVSAVQKDSKITSIEIVSTVGGKFQFVSPWEKVEIGNKKSGMVKEIEIDENGIATFKTTAGEKYLISGIRE